MAKQKRKQGSGWQKTEDGQFIPHFRWKGFSVAGAPRPHPQFLEGERLTVTRYLMCLIAEEIFGEAPLDFEIGDDGEFKNFTRNEKFDNLPFMVEAPDTKLGWVMSDGNPDVMGLFPPLDLSAQGQPQAGESGE